MKIQKSLLYLIVSFIGFAEATLTTTATWDISFWWLKILSSAMWFVLATYFMIKGVMMEMKEKEERSQKPKSKKYAKH